MSDPDVKALERSVRKALPPAMMLSQPVFRVMTEPNRLREAKRVA